MIRASFLSCLAALLLIAGCNVGGFMAQSIDGAKQVDVKAAYYGLNDRSVAVLVAADESQLGRQYFGADRELQIEITRALKQHIPGIRVTNPQQIEQFTENNPFWTVTPYDQLLQRLDVERLVIIDLIHYRLREPGNAHQFRGVIDANVGVAEAEQSTGDLALAKRLTVSFPPNAKFDTIEMNAPTVKLGLHKLFATRVTGIFHDHKVTVDE